MSILKMETNCEVTTMDDRDAVAKRIVEKYCWWSVGAGLVPVPYVDIAAITAVNVKMVKELAANYDVEFSEDRGKAYVSSLLAGVVSGPVAKTAGVKTVLLAIPLIGHSIAILSSSVFAAATTCAIGRVFTQHFGTGGTMLDFEPQKVRNFFSEQYEKGKRMVTRKPASEPDATPA
jgi:uncharacterized protein (DUF697 family)